VRVLAHHRVGELIGYARCSTVAQDLTAQREILAGLGVADDRIYPDKGLTGTNRARPGLDQALAAVRAGDTLVVPKLDRLARSVPDARDIGDTLVARGVRLPLGGSIYDPPIRCRRCSSTCSRCSPSARPTC
jgi:DNA invertase Pin-like site-specific DNA recombinase